MALVGEFLIMLKHTHATVKLNLASVLCWAAKPVVFLLVPPHLPSFLQHTPLALFTSPHSRVRVDDAHSLLPGTLLSLGICRAQRSARHINNHLSPFTLASSQPAS